MDSKPFEDSPKQVMRVTSADESLRRRPSCPSLDRSSSDPISVRSKVVGEVSDDNRRALSTRRFESLGYGSMTSLNDSGSSEGLHRRGKPSLLTLEKGASESVRMGADGDAGACGGGERQEKIDKVREEVCRMKEFTEDQVRHFKNHLEGMWPLRCTHGEVSDGFAVDTAFVAHQKHAAKVLQAHLTTSLQFRDDCSLLLSQSAEDMLIWRDHMKKEFERLFSDPTASLIRDVIRVFGVTALSNRPPLPCSLKCTHHKTPSSLKGTPTVDQILFDDNVDFHALVDQLEELMTGRGGKETVSPPMQSSLNPEAKVFNFTPPESPNTPNIRELESNTAFPFEQGVWRPCWWTDPGSSAVSAPATPRGRSGPSAPFHPSMMEAAGDMFWDMMRWQQSASSFASPHRLRRQDALMMGGEGSLCRGGDVSRRSLDFGRPGFDWVRPLDEGNRMGRSSFQSMGRTHRSPSRSMRRHSAFDISGTSPNGKQKETLPLPKRDPAQCPTVPHVNMIPPTSIPLNFPHDLEISTAANGMDMYWAANTNAHQIVAYDTAGNVVVRWGREGQGEGQLYFPRKLCLVGSLMAVVDRGTARSRLQLFSLRGQLVRQIHLGAGIDIVSSVAVTEKRELILIDSVLPAVYIYEVVTDHPRLVCYFDTGSVMREPSDCAAAGNDVLICDFKAHSIFIYNRSGVLKQRIGTSLQTPYPSGIWVGRGGATIITIDSHGNHPHLTLFYRDVNRVMEFEARGVKIPRVSGLKLDSEGNLVTCAKGTGQAGSLPNFGQLIKFVFPFCPVVPPTRGFIRDMLHRCRDNKWVAEKRTREEKPDEDVVDAGTRLLSRILAAESSSGTLTPKGACSAEE